MRKTVLYTSDDVNDLNIVVTSISEHLTNFKKLVKNGKGKIKDEKAARRYIERCEKLKDFYTKLWVDLQ